METWARMLRWAACAILLSLITDPALTHATPTKSSCVATIQNKTLQETNERSWFNSPYTNKALEELDALSSEGSIPPQLAKLLISRTTPAHIAQWVNYDPTRFKAFYRRLIDSMDIDLICKALPNKREYFAFTAFESDDDWLKFLDADTIDSMIKKLAQVAQKSKSNEPILALRHHLGRILQSELKTELIALFKPLVAKPTFLKSMRHFEEFPREIQDLITQTWGYSLRDRKSDFIADIGLYDNSAEHGKTGRSPCGTCDLMPPAFSSAILAKLNDADSNHAVVIRVGTTPIGLVKNSGDRTFLAIKNVRNPRGELVLVKGGVYGPHNDIGLNRHQPSQDLNSLAANERFFYPLTFMVRAKKAMTVQEFSDYRSILDSLVTSLTPRAKRTEIPPYMVHWQSATDKTAHLNSVNDQTLALILEHDWQNVPNPESFLHRLSSKQAASIVHEKWDLIANPARFLDKIDYDDFANLLQNRWSNIKNPETYLDRLMEYDLGKILANHWGRIRDPEKYFARVQDPGLRHLVIKTKAEKGF